jgi:adenylate cyclase
VGGNSTVYQRCLIAQPSKRKLAAILMADAVGYSRLMGADEAATVASIQASRELFRREVESRSGRIVNAPGDSILADFASVVDALATAVEIQRGLAERNQGVPEAQAMLFRIGINLGDVVESGDDLYGDGVNIAARLESLAEPGGICVSGTAYDQVEGKLPLSYEDIGPQTVKNIREPVRTYRVLSKPGAASHRVLKEKRSVVSAWRVSLVAVTALIVVVVGLYWIIERQGDQGGQSGTNDSPDRASIAVLPFTNMSGDPEQEYFSDGVTDTIITDLSKLRGLMVIARNSTFQYKGKAVDVRQIGSDLGVRYILEGGVQRAEERIRINVQLIDATSGDHVWAERWDNPIEDVFTLQDEITHRIVTELDVQLVEGEQARVWRRTTNHLKAYELYMKGHELHLHFNKADMGEARRLYLQALDLDPHFSQALAWLAWAHFQFGNNGWSDSKSDSMETSRKLAQEAIGYNEFAGDAYAVLSTISRAIDLDYEKTVEYGAKSVEVTPNNADVLAIYSLNLNRAGAKEGLELMNRALRLSPNPPPMYHMHMGLVYLWNKEHEKAIEELNNCIIKIPGFIDCHVGLTLALMEAGRETEARTAAAGVLKIHPRFNSATDASAIQETDPASWSRTLRFLNDAGLP